MDTLEVSDVTEPGWYMSADPRLNENMIYPASTDTLDGKIQWYAMMSNGESTACEPGYIEQAGPIIRVTRPAATSNDAAGDLVEAIRLTVEYVGLEMLPPIEGWSWFDAINKYAPDLADHFVAERARLDRLERA